MLGPWYSASYNAPDIEGTVASMEQNRAAIKARLDEYSLPYLDLTDAFVEDYRLNGKKFDFLYDGHFNAHGHQVMGTAIARHILETGWLDGGPKGWPQRLGL